jgi:Protein UNC80
MQCAEKTPLDLLAIMEVDLQRYSIRYVKHKMLISIVSHLSSNSSTKLAALQKISILTNWRFHILSQHVITDRSHRPFKLARGPLPFVATDIGSSVHVHDEDANDLQDTLPSELRKRLVEIGWDQGDTPVNQQLEWIKTPMSLLPTHQLDHLDSTTLETFPPSPSSPNPNFMTSSSGGDKVEETPGLLRRNSSTGGPIHNLKRRVIFVPSLTAIFPRLASLVFDANYTVAFTARGIIIDLMRNDPALLVRPILDLFVDDQKDMQSAMSGINAFLHVQRILPSHMSHYLFNHLAGFLKYASRNADGNTALQDFAHTVAVLAKLVTQVSGMSIREIRRAKIETFLIPSGSLWFPPSAPIGPMFPRGPDSLHDHTEIVTPDLVSMIMIRTSQNLLFLSMLKRNRQDVQLVRKNMSYLVLPSAGRPFVADVLGLSSFVPHRSHMAENNTSLAGLSLMLSRSYLLLVAQVFRSMSRHLNDRNELAVLIDGLNKILLAHGDDIGIVSQVMIGPYLITQAYSTGLILVSAFMVASTRFRRLFTSGGGYGLFMPAVIKVYAESEGHSGIRLAIEYAINRFYALHQDNFLFQSLDAMVHVVMLPDIEGDFLAKNVYNLFSALRKGILPSTPDPAGIHNANKLEEREALIASTAEEKPQTLMALLRRPQGQDRITIDLPEEYESNRLGIDDFVRLFLTVIAHDPSIVRAERFLRLFLYIAPYLYNASSSARTVLQEGIDALGVVLNRASIKAKPTDGSTTQPVNNGDGFAPTEVMLDGHFFGKSGSPSDMVVMRLDYLLLIAAFTRAGGQLSQPSVLRALDLVRVILKDSHSSHVNDAISRFFAEFTRHSLLRESAPSAKMAVSFLEDLAPVIGGHMTVVDFSAVFETITTLACNPMYANEPSFSRVVVTQICTPGLAACELAASENLLLSFPCRSSLVALLGQAVFLRGANVVPELEKRTASYDFLTGVIFPFAMSLKTGRELSDGLQTDNLHRDTLTSAWIRLLSYSMSACQDVRRRPLERSKSQDRARLNDSQRPTFIMALQILKVIVVRAEPDLTSHLPGLWTRIGAFLKSVLGEGGASFSTHTQDVSPFPSPTASPSMSGQSDPFQSLTPMSAHDSQLNNRSFSSPRAIDYALWSFLELLCLYRNPLMLQMRILVFEKLVELDQGLQHQQGMHTPGSRPASVFSKPRRRMSGLSSPHSSPGLSPSQSFPYDSSLSFDGRQAGYNSTSPSHVSHQYKIVHLGPISPISAFGRALAGGGGAQGMDAMATATKIKSLTLVRATYRRIRIVQRYMGYEPLLPMPHSHEMDADEVFPTSWTRKQALDAILQETRELMEEFEESNGTLQDNAELVDPFVA